MTHKLFAYGTLNLRDVQRWLWGETKQGRVAKLDDYQLNAYDNGIYYIDKKFGETVAGKIYELTEEQLESTDRYEGKSYVKDMVNINGETVNVYIRNKGL